MNTFIYLIVALVLVPASSQAGDADAGKDISSACSACHGPYGLSDSEQYPNLAGQKETYLIKQLQAFQTGQRINTTMQAIAGPLNAQNIDDLAAYFAGNTILPSYSSESRKVEMPFVKTPTDYYQVELGQESDTLFNLSHVYKLP
jgi:cytochrome c553